MPVLNANRNSYSGDPFAPLNVTSGELVRSKSRSLRF